MKAAIKRPPIKLDFIDEDEEDSNKKQPLLLPRVSKQSSQPTSQVESISDQSSSSKKSVVAGGKGQKPRSLSIIDSNIKSEQQIIPSTANPSAEPDQPKQKPSPVPKHQRKKSVLLDTISTKSRKDIEEEFA